MPKIFTLLQAALLSLSLGGVAALAQAGAAAGAAAVDRAEAERWREDLRHMAEEMPRRHHNLFHTLARDQFEGAVRRLDERIPLLARHQIIVEMARIAASVGDGHTNVAPTRDPKVGFRTLPVKLYLFADGLVVRAAERGHADLVGARVLRIGDASAEQALAAVREIVGRDNEMDVRFFGPLLLSMPEVLHAVGLAEETESARFEVEQGGRRRTVVLRPHGPAEMLPPDTDLTWMARHGWADLRDAAPAPAPLWLRDPQDKFWFEYLPASRTVYVQLNQVADKDSETLADFSRRLFAFVDANPVERLALDLRLNRGGNGTLLRPLVTAIIKSKIDRPGKLFVIIGRSTWSAAQFLLNRLEQYTNALFVGEPSGSKGNVYGDSRRITLPRSGVTVRVSVYWWQEWDPWDTRLWTAPHLTAELTSEHYRAGVDPAMRAILGYVPRRPLAELLGEALTRGGAELAVKMFREFKADPVNRYAAVEEPLLVAGQRLLNEKKPGQALTLFKLNAEENPHSFRAYFAMGVAQAESGDKEQGIRNLEKALGLNPKSYDVFQALRQLRQK